MTGTDYGLGPMGYKPTGNTDPQRHCLKCDHALRGSRRDGLLRCRLDEPRGVRYWVDERGSCPAFKPFQISGDI